MKKVKYHFNPKTLTYEKVTRTVKYWFLRILSFLTTSVAFSFMLVLLFLNFFDSPREKQLRREVKEYELQFEQMNKRLGQIESVLGNMAERDDNLYRVIFEAEPIPNDVRKAGFGGVDRYSKLEGYANSRILIETSKKLDIITSQIVVQSKSFDDVYEMALNKNRMLASIPAIQPVSNKKLKRLSSFFGFRTDPIYKVKKFHEGVDFTAPIGTDIYSTGDGDVVECVISRQQYGNTIIIDHGYGYKTLYAHLSKILVKPGQKVKRGEVIGKIGNTGKSTAPHLHYEVHKNGQVVNPIHYFFSDLTPAEYEEVLFLSQQPTQTLD